MLGDVNKLFDIKSLLTMPSNVLPSHLKPTFQLIVWISTDDDGIESRLLYKIKESSYEGLDTITKKTWKNQTWICNVTDELKHFALQLYFMHCRPKCCTAFLGGPWFNYYICPSLVIWTTVARISYFSQKSMRKSLINKNLIQISDSLNFYSNNIFTCFNQFQWHLLSFESYFLYF